MLRTGLYSVILSVAPALGAAEGRGLLGQRWRFFLRQAVLLATVGVAFAMPVTLALSRAMRSVVYGIKPHDPITLIRAAVLMITVAALAAWLPARRAAKVDPMEALRYE